MANYGAVPNTGTLFYLEDNAEFEELFTRPNFVQKTFFNDLESLRKRVKSPVFGNCFTNKYVFQNDKCFYESLFCEDLEKPIITDEKKKVVEFHHKKRRKSVDFIKTEL